MKHAKTAQIADDSTKGKPSGEEVITEDLQHDLKENFGLKAIDDQE